MNHAFYMKLALDEAWKYQLLTYPNPAVGAVVVGSHGEILSIKAHQKAGEAHAEVLALQEAYHALTDDKRILSLESSHQIHDFLIKHHNDLFSDCTLYVTLEPCHHTGKTPPCSSLLELLNINNIVIGTNDTSGARGGANRLRSLGRTVIEGVLEESCRDLLAPFLLWSQDKPFNVFKVAQRLNGTIDGGTISCESSRRHVHRIRSIVDKMVIGGNTVRIDRPTLDSRLIKGRAPDIIIYSHQTAFDTMIPLFSVPKREVRIESNREKLFARGLTLVEGGSGTFKSLLPQIDWIMVYQSGSIKAGVTIDQTFDGKIMHTMPIGDDYLLWIKRKNIE